MAELAAHSRLEAMVGAIVERVQPELVLLFGSRANGKFRPDSDYDLMVVVRDGADAEADRAAAYDALHAAGYSADVLARSVTDYQRRQHDPGFLDWLVAREGKLLYTTGRFAQYSRPPPRVGERPTEGLATWLERAEEDFRVVSRLIRAGDPGRGAICFHAHVCVEKLLKAWIISRGNHPPRTHELPELVSLLPAERRSDPRLTEAGALLQKLYPKSRYPEHPMPTPDEAQSAFDAAGRVRERLLPGLLPGTKRQELLPDVIARRTSSRRWCWVSSRATLGDGCRKLRRQVRRRVSHAISPPCGWRRFRQG